MTMMISKFHKMIQSKVVWFIVLGVIIITFVFWGIGSTALDGASREQQQQAQSIGTLFGADVTRSQYTAALRHTQTWYILSTGRMPTEQTAAMMSEQAWVRLAALRKATAQKIEISNLEVKNRIKAMPISLNESGQFDQDAYDTRLKQFGMLKERVEATVREQIAIDKLMAGSMHAALVTPTELEQAYHTVTDQLVFEYAVLPRENVAKDISVTLEEAKAFFAENPERFTVPAKVNVSYVEFVASNYVDQVELAEGVALQQYNQNIEYFRVENTNETAEVEYKPFEEVEGEIVEKVKKQMAYNKAGAQATALVETLSRAARNDKLDFYATVAAAGLTVKTRTDLGLSDDLPDMNAPSLFKQAALQLQEGVQSSFSDVVRGTDRVYVISLDKRFEPFVPEFEAAKDDVMAATKSRAVVDALGKRSEEIYDTLKADLESGKSFKEAVAVLDLSVETTEAFSLSSVMESEYGSQLIAMALLDPSIQTIYQYGLAASLDSDYANQLVAAGLNAREGELCTPDFVPGGVLFTYLAQRKASDPELGMAAVHDQLVSVLSSIGSQRMNASWQTALMNEANLQLK
jgi:hypothetical protein